MHNKSLRYEFDFIHYFNNKTFSELSDKWKRHFKRMFPQIEENTLIHCSKHENYFAKGDIDIRIKGDSKIISLKNGKNACMHRERFTWLYHYLKNKGISSETLNIITLYHFGECRAFGHRVRPLAKDEIVEKYSDLIQKANQELNDEKIIDLIIERAVIQGRKDYRLKIDYLYYGNIAKGILISREQIYDSIKSRKKISDSWLHFGQLVYQPGGRSRNNNDYLETTIRWPVLGKLFYIATNEDDILACNIEETL